MLSLWPIVLQCLVWTQDTNLEYSYLELYVSYYCSRAVTRCLLERVASLCYQLVLKSGRVFDSYLLGAWR